MSGEFLPAVVGVIWQRVRSIEEILREGEAARGGNGGMSDETIGALVFVGFFLVVAVMFLYLAYREKIRQHIRKEGLMRYVGYAGLALMLGCFVWGVVQTKGYPARMTGQVMTPWLVMGGIIGGVSVALLFLAHRR